MPPIKKRLAEKPTPPRHLDRFDEVRHALSPLASASPARKEEVHKLLSEMWETENKLLDLVWKIRGQMSQLRILACVEPPPGSPEADIPF